MLAAPAQNRLSHARGLHRGCPALVQVGKVLVRPDGDRDELLEPGELQTSQRDGFNVHDVGHPDQLAGCVGLAKADMHELLSTFELLESEQGKLVTLTVIESVSSTAAMFGTLWLLGIESVGACSFQPSGGSVRTYLSLGIVLCLLGGLLVAPFPSSANPAAALGGIFEVAKKAGELANSSDRGTPEWMKNATDLRMQIESILAGNGDKHEITIAHALGVFLDALKEDNSKLKTVEADLDKTKAELNDLKANQDEQKQLLQAVQVELKNLTERKLIKDAYVRQELSSLQQQIQALQSPKPTSP